MGAHGRYSSERNSFGINFKYQIFASLTFVYVICSIMLLMAANKERIENVSPDTWKLASSSASPLSHEVIQINITDYVSSKRFLSSASVSTYESRSSDNTKQVSLLPPWIETWKLPKTSFTPQKFPILIFSNYRHAYLTKCLESIGQSAKDIDSSTVCVFALQRTTNVSNMDVDKTMTAIKKVNFCRKIVLQANKDGSASVLHAENYKKHWWKTISQVFKREGVFETLLRDWNGGDMLILEEDVVLSPDFVKAFWFASHVKSSVATPICQIALGGWSGSNLANGHPNTFAIRRCYYLQPMAYGFNSSFFRFLWRHEDEWLDDNNYDFSESIGRFIRERQTPFLAVVPTMARLWHIGAKGLGSSGTGGKRNVAAKPPWARTPHLLVPEQAQLNKGVRDLFGLLCPPEKVLDAGRFCSDSYAKFVDKYAFTLKCIKQNYVSDPCIEP